MRLTNMAQFHKMIDDVKRKAELAETEGPRKAGEEYVANVKSEIQNRGSVVSGSLLGSIGINEEGANYAVAGSTAPHAIPFEYGRGPVIPVTKKYLHFTTKDGTEVFTKFSQAVEPANVFTIEAIRLRERYPHLIVEFF